MRHRKVQSFCYGLSTIALLMFLFTGCAKQKTTQPSSENDSTNNQTKTDSNTKQTKNKQENKFRKTLAGNWLLTLCEKNSQKPIGIIQISSIDQPATKPDSKTDSTNDEKQSADAEKKHQIKLLDVWEGVGNQELISGYIKGNSIDLVLKSANGPMHYQGSLEEGFIRGSMLLPQLEGLSLPMVFLPFQGQKLPKDIKPLPYRHGEELSNSLKGIQTDNKKMLAACRKFTKEHGRSPISMFLFEDVLFTLARENKLTEKEVDELAKEFVDTAANWGDRYQAYARIQVGKALLQSSYLPKTAKQYLATAKEKMSKEQQQLWKALLQRLDETADTIVLVQNLKSEDAEVKKSAADGLAQLLEKNPFNFPILLLLAEHYEKEELADLAMARYGELAMIPLFEDSLQKNWEAQKVDRDLPSEVVSKLWKKKHGSTDKLDNYLNDIYNRLIESIPNESFPPRGIEQGKHVVLGELLTGAMCPACAAVDMATSGLDSTFKDSEFIMLRYHIPVPGPDQLANQDTLNRQMYYRHSGAPVMLLDGQLARRGGGSPQEAQAIYKDFKEQVKQKLKNKTHLAIKLSAEAEAGKLKLKADVSGLKKTDSKLRLRLVLAEDSIPFIAGNGIRQHDMVVRSMPGGYEGIEVKDDKLSFESTIVLEEFKQDLLEYLAAFEEEHGHSFAVKPMDLDKLHFVGLVQDDQSGIILQSAIIPVSGKLEYPKPPVAPQTKPQPAENSQTKQKSSPEKPQDKSADSKPDSAK